VDFINQGFGPGLLFSAGLSFGELAFRAIRGGGGGEEDEYIRAILPVRELTYGAREFAALASPGGWRQRYEDALRDRIAKVRAELTAKGFRWKECTLTAACLLPASRADELGKPAKPGLYERLSGGEKFGLAELKPHLEPLKGEDGRAGIVILLLGDGAREAAIRLDTMVTRRGRCVQLLSPVIEVHSVGPASGAGAGAGAKPGEKPVGKPVAPDPAKQP
ncbi:MAG TPA: hypothetical protein PK280_19595, partial [Planctomycetota bacterium]|nr:hypothetical protein [Planctomycetota bacterium]